MAYEWDAEGGTDGAGTPGPLTPGNSGNSGFVLATAINTGTSIDYATTAALDGALGLNITRASGSAAVYFQQATGTVTGTARKRQRGKVRFTSWPTSDVQIANHRSGSTGSTQVGMVFVNSTGKFEVRNSAGVTVWTSAQLTLNTKYRFGFNTKGGTSTGVLEFAYYLDNAATPVEPAAILTAQNGGADPLVTYTRWGRGGDTWVGTYQLDSIAYDSLDDAGFIPNAVVTAPTTAAGFQVDSRSSGGAAPVKVSGATLTYTSPVAGVYLFAQGAVAVYSFDGVNVTIPALAAGGTSTVYAPKRYNPATGTWV